MGEVNSHGERRASERDFELPAPAQGAQPSAKNGRIPGLQRAGDRAERVSPKGVLAERAGFELSVRTVFQVLESYTPGLARARSSTSTPRSSKLRQLLFGLAQSSVGPHRSGAGALPTCPRCASPAARSDSGVNATAPPFRRFLTRGVGAGVRWTCNVSFDRNVMRNVPPQGSPAPTTLPRVAQVLALTIRCSDCHRRAAGLNLMERCTQLFKDDIRGKAGVRTMPLQPLSRRA
jgi:hypothetical protein